MKPEDQRGAGYSVERPSAYRNLVEDLLSLRHEFALCNHHIEVDLSAVEKSRSRFSAKTGGEPSYSAYFVHAMSRALVRHPRLNSHLVTFPRKYLAIYDGVDVIYTIETQGASGSVVLLDILRDASRLKIEDIDSRLAAAAGTGFDQLVRTTVIAHFIGLPRFLRRLFYRLWLKPSPRRYREMLGTCAFTSVGQFGIEMATAIVPRTIGIIAGAVMQRPIVRDGVVVTAPTVWLTVAYDHRVVDGGDAARFAVDVKRVLEEFAVAT